MGTDVVEAVEGFSYPYSFKVHHSMCTELMKLVDRITKIFPEIEAARPRCSSGIQALCLLNSAIDRAKQLLQHCRESSKLYLAYTGEVILLRCQRSRDLLAKSLAEIQTMVPVILAAEISQIIDDLRAATFVLDFLEEDAGKAIHDLLHHGTSVSDSVEVLQLVASRLNITSQKALLIERRSIRKLLEKVGNNESSKGTILRYLLCLLKKHENSMKGEQNENPNSRHDRLSAVMESGNSSTYGRTVEVESTIERDPCGTRTNMLNGATPPEEYKCPISKKLMYDPVVITSGQTFERMWIQKWFDEGNDTCPTTKKKLVHLSLIPNTALKELISKWCVKFEITVTDPSLRAFQSLDISCTSIASLSSLVNDLQLPLDVSNISIGSLDTSCSSDSLRVKATDGSRLTMMRKSHDNYTCQPNADTNETDLTYLLSLDENQWESQCKVVEHVKNLLQHNDQVFDRMSSGDYVEPIIRFLRDARDSHDARAQIDGLQLLLMFMRKNRSGMSMSCLKEDAFSLLVSYLDSEVIEEALALLEVLSGDAYCRSKIATAGALESILKFLDSQNKEFQERAIQILHNLSSNSDVCSQIVSLGCISKLVPFINDSNVARYCIVLLKNLCDTEEARVSVAETNGCIASIVELLESGSYEVQEHSVAVLLSLCSQRVQYCQLVMKEGVIPSLCKISINGSDKGKASASELLRQLKDVDYESVEECLGSDLDSEREASNYSYHSVEKKSASKASGWKNFFSKPKSLASKKKG